MVNYTLPGRSIHTLSFDDYKDIDYWMTNDLFLSGTRLTTYEQTR